MKKSLLLILPAIALTSCNPAGNKGIVDCKTINVNGVMSESYKKTHSLVYQYKSLDGKSFYTNYSLRNNTYYKEIIRTYANEHTSDYKDYYFVGLVGYLTMEYKYYLHLDNGTVDSVVSWSKYKYDKDPDSAVISSNIDNKEAYRGAKKGYHYLGSLYAPYSSYYSTNQNKVEYTLVLESLDLSLERHTYIRTNNQSVITFTER